MFTIVLSTTKILHPPGGAFLFFKIFHKIVEILMVFIIPNKIINKMLWACYTRVIHV